MLVPQMIISGRFEFGALTSECYIELPALSPDTWKDLTLRFTTEASPRSGLCPTKLGLFLNDRNVTNFLFEQIESNIAEVGFEKVRQRYLHLARVRQSFEHKSLPAITSFALYAENQYIEEIPSLNINRLLDVSGESYFGYGNNLALTNFLFKYIDVKPVSLADIAKSAGIDFANCRNLTFTYGPQREMDPGWEPQNPQGCIAYSIEFQPASDDNALLSTIADQVEQISERTSINGGQLFLKLSAIQSTLDKLSVLLQDCTRVVGSPSDIQAIEKSLDDVRRALHI